MDAMPSSIWSTITVDEGRATLPEPRGRISAAVIDALNGAGDMAAARRLAECAGDDVLQDEDAQLALTMLYEVAIRGFTGVDDRWEWDPELLTTRAALEARTAPGLERAALGLLDRAGIDPHVAGRDAVDALWRLTAYDEGPALSAHVERRATVEQIREILVHRSLYQLREGDLHTLGIPRLGGRPKAALIEVQTDEYGDGRLGRMHSTLFAVTMASAGLSTGYFAYLDAVPGRTLAALNALSLFGLHRARLGELIGHLAAIEMTSSGPSRRYSAGLRRLGFDAPARRFYDEHIEADAMHEQVVARDLVAPFVADSPERGAAVLTGAATFLALEIDLAIHLLGAWDDGHSSLRLPVGEDGAIARTSTSSSKR